MGGQACVFYGAAQFSRDTDLALHAEPANLDRLRGALHELHADVIAVPPFEQTYLDMGLAVHFRCAHPDALDMRIDVLSVMRGVAPFARLWERRTTIQSDGEPMDLLSLPDLVQAKKTQRDKDWPMLAALVEVSFRTSGDAPRSEQIAFWLAELRSPHSLIEAVERFPREAQLATQSRSLLSAARLDNEPALRALLRDEEDRERELDRQYWQPLKATLEQLRLSRRKRQDSP